MKKFLSNTEQLLSDRFHNWKQKACQVTQNKIYIKGMKGNIKMINDLKIFLVLKGYKVKDGSTTLNINNELIPKSQINNFKILDSLDIKINLNDDSYLVF